MNRVRAAALVLPVLALLWDAGGVLEVVADGRRCGEHCYAGVVVLPFAPVITPLFMAGLGDADADQSLVSAVVAYAVVGAVMLAWWWRVGGVLAGRRWWVAVGLWSAAVAATLVMKLPGAVVADRLPALGLVLEAAALALVWRWTAALTAGRPRA